MVKATASKDLVLSKNRVEEERKSEIGTAIENQRPKAENFSIQLIKGDCAPSTLLRESEKRPSDLLNFGTSDEEEKKSLSSSDEKRGLPLDFYSKNEQITKKIVACESSGNDSPRSSHDSNMLLQQFSKDKQQRDARFGGEDSAPNSDGKDQITQQLGRDSEEQKRS